MATTQLLDGQIRICTQLSTGVLGALGEIASRFPR